MAQFDWVGFYRQFAYKLLAYRGNRGALIEHIRGVYAETGIRMPTLERDNQIVDIDPFTVFGLFNKTSMRAENRTKLLTAMAMAFDVQAAVPTAFDSIPVLDNRNATFYDFIENRAEDAIENLWELFAAALAYAEKTDSGNRERLSQYFDLVINSRWNGNSKVTMALYWIAPDTFLNLDSRNEWYIYQSGKLPAAFVDQLPKVKSKISAARYFEIVGMMRAFLGSGESPLRDFKELSYEAWRHSEEVNRAQRAAAIEQGGTDATLEETATPGAAAADTPETPTPATAYTAKDFLREVYMEEADYRSLVHVLSTKQNIILQGAPGVGKTFAAQRLAYSVMGARSARRVLTVQFHQSYSYEDFVMGYRPSAEGFRLRKGAFYHFCKQAERDGANDYFFIIDEINRGNLSKIFGELFMLIEPDKRGATLPLLYVDDSGERDEGLRALEHFAVPKNLYIIGTMNTADRSLAMLDYALRRRFAFFDLRPAFGTAGFRAYQTLLGSPKLDRLIQCIERLNEAIERDESLGEGFCIGHSYFCNLKPEEVDDRRLRAIVEYELIPLLKEYWVDEPGEVHTWSRELRGAVQ